MDEPKFEIEMRVWDEALTELDRIAKGLVDGGGVYHYREGVRDLWAIVHSRYTAVKAEVGTESCECNRDAAYFKILENGRLECVKCDRIFAQIHPTIKTG